MMSQRQFKFLAKQKQVPRQAYRLLATTLTEVAVSANPVSGTAVCCVGVAGPMERAVGSLARKEGSSRGGARSREDRSTLGASALAGLSAATALMVAGRGGEATLGCATGDEPAPTQSAAAEDPVRTLSSRARGEGMCSFSARFSTAGRTCLAYKSFTASSRPCMGRQRAGPGVGSHETSRSFQRPQSTTSLRNQSYQRSAGEDTREKVDELDESAKQSDQGAIQALLAMGGRLRGGRLHVGVDAALRKQYGLVMTI